MKLFGVPFAGGSSYCYRNLEKVLDNKIDWETLELPGRGRRSDETLLTNIEGMASDILAQISCKTSENFALFGHSMGGLIVHRVAQDLQGNCVKSNGLAHLFISGCRPHFKSRLHAARSDYTREELMDAVDKLGGLPKELREDKELMAFFEPVLRADFGAVDCYIQDPSIRIAAPISVFYGIDDVEVMPEDARKWSGLSDSKEEFFSFEGDHFFFLDHCDTISKLFLQKLKDYL